MDDTLVHFFKSVPIHVYQADLVAKCLPLQVHISSQLNRPAMATATKSNAYRQLFSGSKQQQKSPTTASNNDANFSQVYTATLKSKITLQIRITDETDLFFMCSACISMML